MQKKYPDTIQVFYELIDALHKIIISIAMTIIKGMPYAVLALLANTIAQRGLNSILEVGKFIVILYIACIIQLMIQLLAISFSKVNPITYLKKAILYFLAFTSRSSLGVLPATIDTLTQKLPGVSQGCSQALYPALEQRPVCRAVQEFFRRSDLSMSQTSGTPIDISLIIMSIIVITIGSIGIAGIRYQYHGGLSRFCRCWPRSILCFHNTNSGNRSIIDMMRTMLNVSGSLTNAIMVDRQLELMDMELYQDMAGKESEKE